MRRPTSPAVTRSPAPSATPRPRALAEWIAIRTAPRNVGYDRITRFLETYPNWPSNQTLRRRAEEALYFSAVDPADHAADSSPAASP